MRKSESSRTPMGLPALMVALTVVWLSPAPALGQNRYRVARSENFRQQPDANASRLGVVQNGVLVDGVSTRGQWVEVNLTGWIWSRSIGRTNDAVHDLQVTAAGGENLRNDPNGQLVARLNQGALLDEVERDGNWVRVNRIAWMWGESLQPVPGTGARTGSSSQRDPTSASLSAALLRGQSAIRDAPDGAQRAVASGLLPVRVVSRSGDWVRVQLEGWVRESDLTPADDEVLIGVTGAEVRANPDIYEGKLVQWRLQYISLQVADELRRDLPTGQTYILARGPVPEPGFVYALIQDDMQPRFETLSPLSEVVVIGRVRRGRSEQLGNPIIELVDVSAAEQ